MWQWLRWVLIGVGVLFIALVLGLNMPRWYESWRAEREATRQLVYVVPKGTVAKLGSGAALDVLPNSVELTIGGKDTLIIRNEDAYPIEVGGMRVAPGQQYKQQFVRPGVYDLVCSVHTAEKIRVIVKARP